MHPLSCTRRILFSWRCLSGSFSNDGGSEYCARTIDLDATILDAIRTILIKSISGCSEQVLTQNGEDYEASRNTNYEREYEGLRSVSSNNYEGLRSASTTKREFGGCNARSEILGRLKQRLVHRAAVARGCGRKAHLPLVHFFCGLVRTVARRSGTAFFLNKKSTTRLRTTQRGLCNPPPLGCAGSPRVLSAKTGPRKSRYFVTNKMHKFFGKEETKNWLILIQ